MRSLIKAVAATASLILIAPAMADDISANDTIGIGALRCEALAEDIANNPDRTELALKQWAYGWASGFNEASRAFDNTYYDVRDMDGQSLLDHLLEYCTAHPSELAEQGMPVYIRALPRLNADPQ